MKYDPAFRSGKQERNRRIFAPRRRSILGVNRAATGERIEARPKRKDIRRKNTSFPLVPYPPLPTPPGFTFNPFHPRFSPFLLPRGVIAFETLHYTPATPFAGTPVHLCLPWLSNKESASGRKGKETEEEKEKKEKKETARAKRRFRMKGQEEKGRKKARRRTGKRRRQGKHERRSGVYI